MINVEKEKNKSCDGCGTAASELILITAKKSKNAEKKTRLCTECALKLNDGLQKLLFAATKR